MPEHVRHSDASKDMQLDMGIIKVEVSVKKAGVAIDFPMVSDGDGTTFKKFGVYDETDREPLHGLFLLDADGKVRWRDIAPDPCLSFRSFRSEAQRLLKTTSDVRR